MENETVSKNFIENIIDEDLAEGVYDTYTPVSHRNRTGTSISDMPNPFF